MSLENLSKIITNQNAVTVDDVVNKVGNLLTPDLQSIDNFKRVFGSGFRRNRFFTQFRFKADYKDTAGVFYQCLNTLSLIPQTKVQKVFSKNTDLLIKDFNYWISLCLGFTIPDFNLETTGAVEANRRYIKDMATSPLQVSIANDDYSLNYEFWRTYCSTVTNKRRLRYPEKYKFDIELTIFDNARNSFITYTFYECMVTTLSGLELDRTSGADVFRFNLTIDWSDYIFKYDPPKFINVFFKDVNVDEYAKALTYLATTFSIKQLAPLIDEISSTNEFLGEVADTIINNSVTTAGNAALRIL